MDDFFFIFFFFPRCIQLSPLNQPYCEILLYIEMIIRKILFEVWHNYNKLLRVGSCLGT